MNKNQSPFRPPVTRQHIQGFDPDRKETNTPSGFVNVVLTAIAREHLTRQNEVAFYLAVNQQDLGGALRIYTGLGFNDLRDLYLRSLVERIKAEHPDWKTEQIAKAIGYKDHSSLWRLFHREYDHNYNKRSSERSKENLERWEREMHERWLREPEKIREKLHQEFLKLQQQEQQRQQQQQ